MGGFQKLNLTVKEAHWSVTQLAEKHGVAIQDFVHGCLFRLEETGRRRVRQDIGLTAKELDLVIAYAARCKPMPVWGGCW